MSRSVLSLESTWLKIVGLAILLFCLLSVDYSGFSLSSSLSYPIALIIASIADTLILSYFVLFSRFNGWKLWVAVFSIFYVSSYVLTAVESVYLSSLLTASLVARILINGAVVSAVFGAALVIVLGKRAPAGGPFQNHLSMSWKQWIVRILGSVAVYL